VKDGDAPLSHRHAGLPGIPDQIDFAVSVLDALHDLGRLLRREVGERRGQLVPHRLLVRAERGIDGGPHDHLDPTRRASGSSRLRSAVRPQPSRRRALGSGRSRSPPLRCAWVGSVAWSEDGGQDAGSQGLVLTWTHSKARPRWRRGRRPYQTGPDGDISRSPAMLRLYRGSHGRSRKPEASLHWCGRRGTERHLVQEVGHVPTTHGARRPSADQGGKLGTLRRPTCAAPGRPQRARRLLVRVGLCVEPIESLATLA
jgi:hypothetical protein